MFLHFFLKCREWIILVLVILSLSACSELSQEDIIKKKYLEDSSIIKPTIPNIVKLQELMLQKKQEDYYPFFENKKKYSVGDMITVILQENTIASNNSNSRNSNDKNVAFGFNSIPRIISMILGINQNRAIFDESSKNFNVNGDLNSNQNHFEGFITVTITQIMNNGNLKIAGEKKIGINQNVEFIRFSGIINPDNINANNFIESKKVANTYIFYVNSKNEINDQNIIWGGNWISSLLPI
ncbi:flagellar basal body L-ring protein FlgH [Buchnera aphidicola (Thelaxes californica)]|uniref:Flagellar basal body L-ring protein FlgH n=1 Tax=Buchnera aphidicola (Thelaxes californica) TaxID=1315998 RepID=A0A4D6YM57_9GAMM|nr:flagellar basal body L-ring protein FlgH [Buchnera aphidicola]QCI26798.1 flagellar basal body L-ring protein FlgH [Buchnera aphidicola (Thelaxes californica)]